MSSTDDDDIAGIEGVELAADPAARVNLDSELLQLRFARGPAALGLATGYLSEGSFFAAPLQPTLALADMDAAELLTSDGFITAVAAWHERLHGAPMPPATRARLADLAADFAEAGTEDRAVPDHIYTLY